MSDEPRSRRGAPERLLLAALAAIWIAGCGAGTPGRDAPPDPDTAAFEVDVAQKIRESRAAVLRDPDSAAAWGRLGIVFDAHGLTAEAVLAYTRAEGLDPEDFRWPYLAGTCAPDENRERVIAQLERARALRPDYPAVHVRLGDLLLQLGRLGEAEQAFRAGIEADAEDSHAWFGLGRVELTRGDLEASRQALETAIAMRSRHREVHATLSRVYRELGLPDRASHAAERAGRGTRRTQLRDAVRREVYAQGVSAFHRSSRAHELIDEGEYAEALALLEQSLAVRTRNPEAHLDLGRVLVLLGREAQGLAALAEANRLSPGIVDVEQMLEELREWRAEDEAEALAEASEEGKEEE